MSIQHGHWTIQQTKVKYHNSFINIREYQVLQPNNIPGIYAIVKMKPGVTILPIDNDNKVYLTKQFRYALGKETAKL